MASWRPDQSFYPTAKMAMEAAPETFGYVALLNPKQGGHDAMAVVDLDPESPKFGTPISHLEFPGENDELHHFGWNACSSCLCPYSPHPHMERRYLVVPGLKSSRLHILDTKPNPREPRFAKIIEPEEVMKRTGYSRPHTSHCGPEGIYLNGLGSANGSGPGGIFMLDPETFEIKGKWEKDRGPQYLAYDFWWHLGHDTLLTSEWGTPDLFENGLVPEALLKSRYGHAMHVWNLRTRTHQQKLDLGPEHQMVLELRPAHDPRETHGFAGVVISIKDLSASVWTWYREGSNGESRWNIRKTIEIPAEPAPADKLPPVLQGFGAAAPLVTDIALSLDDRFLYVSCWGTGELRQYDVSDPFNPVLKSSLRIGGMVNRTPHPKRPDKPLNGGPQMIELSRDGKRLYLTNSLYGAVDPQFYPDGIRGWMAKVDIGAKGGMAFDPRFLIEFDEFRPHQVRLEGGDASSDSYCYA